MKEDPSLPTEKPVNPTPVIMTPEEAQYRINTIQANQEETKQNPPPGRIGDSVLSDEEFEEELMACADELIRQAGAHMEIPRKSPGYCSGL